MLEPAEGIEHLVCQLHFGCFTVKLHRPCSANISGCCVNDNRNFFSRTIFDRIDATRGSPASSDCLAVGPRRRPSAGFDLGVGGL
jgi:hypothetical protein